MSSQQFCLKWNNHTTNMLNVFEHLLSTEALVDVTLACDGLSLKAHKMVLSACSPFFQSLFLENPCKHPIVIMKDMSYKDLKAIIDFMYRGEVNVSQDQLSALLKTAETLKVKGLAEVTGENRQAAGVVQQEISTPTTNSVQNSQQNSQSMRPESPPMHGKRKRGRPRKRSLSDSNRSDDELVPSKIKEPESPEIEELSGDASLDGGDMIRSNSSSQSQVHQPSVNTFSSSSKHHSSAPSHQVNAQVDEPPSGDDNEFEVEPSKLLEQTLTTDNVPSNASNNIATSHFNLPSSSGIEISQVGLGDSQALVPVSSASDGLSSSHLQGPDSPQDIKPAILTFDEPPISPVAGPSHQSSDRSMMMYMDQSSMPGPSNYQDQSLVQHDSQPQGSECANEIEEPVALTLDDIFRIYACMHCPKRYKKIGFLERHLILSHSDQSGATKTASSPVAQSEPPQSPTLPVIMRSETLNDEKKTVAPASVEENNENFADSTSAASPEFPSYNMDEVIENEDANTSTEKRIVSGKKKKKRSASLPLPLLKKVLYDQEKIAVPFTEGWTREIVHRNCYPKKGSIKAIDTYYFSPDGIKFRSKLEISKYLAKHNIRNLSSQNFTFTRRKVFREPYERERDARSVKFSSMEGREDFHDDTKNDESTVYSSTKEYSKEELTPGDSESDSCSSDSSNYD